MKMSRVNLLTHFCLGIFGDRGSGPPESDPPNETYIVCIVSKNVYFSDSPAIIMT